FSDGGVAWSIFALGLVSIAGTICNAGRQKSAEAASEAEFPTGADEPDKDIVHDVFGFRFVNQKRGGQCDQLVFVLFIYFAQRIRVTTVEPPNEVHVSEHCLLNYLSILTYYNNLARDFSMGKVKMNMALYRGAATTKGS